MTLLKLTCTPIILIPTASLAFTILWQEMTWGKSLTLSFQDRNFFLKFICAGQPECSVRSSSIKCCILFCKLRKTGLTGKTWDHLKKMLFNCWRIRNNISDSWCYLFLNLSQKSRETPMKKQIREVLRRNRRTKF